MKTLACCAALLTLALAAPAWSDTVTAYANDFDAPAMTAAGVTSSFTGVTSAVNFPTANSYGAWNGKRLFNIDGAGAASVFTLSNLPTHSGISMSFILGFLGSWDSSDGDDGLAPDYLDIFIDGSQVAQLTYNNRSGTVKQIAGGTLLAEYDPTFSGPLFPQTVVDMSTASFANFAHSASTFTLSIAASGAGFTGGSDEEWGLDGLRIDLTGAGVPEPSTWAMLIAGFGLSGAALRRRRAVGAA